MIRIEQFTRMFGESVAVYNLTMHVREGDIFGFIGPNGAGKTTTMKFLATLLRPTAGHATVAGHSVTRHPSAVRRVMGYMPDSFGVYEGMRVWEYLDFFAAAYRIHGKKRRQVVGDVIDLLDLGGKRDDFVEALSRGMRQRLCLAKTLVHDPKVLILDEPASGLDPRARMEIKELLLELQKMGKTIFISSHILSELAGICTRIGIIEKGKLLACGTVEEIKGSIKQHRILEIQILNGVGKTKDILMAHPAVRDVDAYGETFRVEFAGGIDEISAVHRSLIEGGVQILWFREQETDLEEVFLTVTKGEVA
jgi:ABC-2 type transport system ATP-binding protein